MRITCIGGGWYPQSPGGLEKYTHGLSRALTRAGDEVALFVSGEPQPWDARSTAFSIAKPADALPQRLVSAFRCYAKHRLASFDVVNAHFALDALPLLWHLKTTTPLVIHFHGPWAEESRVEGGGSFSVALKRQIERIVYRRGDRFIVLSSAFKDILCRSYGVPEDRVSIIPMGIDGDFFVPPFDRDAVRARWKWPREKMVVFTARRLVQRVGVLELVEAAAMLKAEGLPLLFKIAGKGALAAELQRSIEERDLADTIELLGFLSEEQLVEAYQGADLTILPTQHLEGFGTIIAESLACGTPVIGTPVGGIPEALGRLDRRLVSRSSTPADIAALLRSIASGELALPERELCRQHAMVNYSWESVVGQIRTVLGEAAKWTAS